MAKGTLIHNIHINSVHQNAVVSAMEQFQKNWKPIEIEVGEVFLISRTGFEDPFVVNYRVPFGDKPVGEVTPYVPKPKAAS